jgi:hypothetical protein
MSCIETSLSPVSNKKMSTKKTGILFVLFLFLSTIHSAAQQTKQPPVRISKLITTISDSLSRYYIFPEKAGEITAYLKSRERTGYDSLPKTPQKPTQQLATDQSCST